MIYNNREDVERIGKAGAYSKVVLVGNKPGLASRILSSYWMVTADADDHFTPHLKNDGFWEAWNTLWISKNVKPGSTVIDAGANYGYYTFFLATFCRKVFAIEPNPYLKKYLDVAIDLNYSDNIVEIVPKALAGSHTELTLEITESPLHSFVASDNDGAIRTSAIKEPVKVTTCKLTDFKGVDFVKMDIEGLEREALEEVGEFFKINPTCVIMYEFVYNYYKDGGAEFLNHVLKFSKVSYVDYDGEEVEVTSYEQIKDDDQDLRMYLLRKL